MFRLFIVVLLASAGSVSAAAVTLPGTGPISENRGFTRGGPYDTKWKNPAETENTGDHQGRSAGTFEDSGRGQIEFEVKADKDGKAVVLLQDVGDTKHFGGFTLNGEKIDIPAPGKNASMLRVLLDFGAAGWHNVVAATTLKPGLKAGKLDGFSVGVCRR